jgi:hypothetical protein
VAVVIEVMLMGSLTGAMVCVAVVNWEIVRVWEIKQDAGSGFYRQTQTGSPVIENLQIVLNKETFPLSTMPAYWRDQRDDSANSRSLASNRRVGS